MIIVGAGGGAIKPMQHRWENWLNTAQQDAATIAARTSTRTGVDAGQYAPAPAQPLYPSNDPTRPIDPNAGGATRY